MRELGYTEQKGSLIDWSTNVCKLAIMAPVLSTSRSVMPLTSKGNLYGFAPASNTISGAKMLKASA